MTRASLLVKNPRSVLALLCLNVGAMSAQSAVVPISRLQIVNSADLKFSTVFGVHELSDGRVVVNDAGRRQLFLLSSDLRTAVTVLDSASNSLRWYGPSGAGILHYRADTTIFVAAESQALVLIAPDGTIARTVALSRPVEAAALSGAMYGGPGIDRDDRLVYRLNAPPRPLTGGRVDPNQSNTSIVGEIATPDSAPIVRLSLRDQSFDTVTWVRVAPIRSVLEVTAQGRRRRVIRNPLPEVDDFVALSDGRVAIIRGHDYHLDLVMPDRSLRRFEKLPFAWYALDESAKASLVDSLRRTTIQSDDPRVVIDFIRSDELPSYIPPLRPSTRNMFADPQNRIWVLPSTSNSPERGLLYDIIGSDGHLDRRVRFPEGRVLIGFGASGAIFLLSRAADQGILLERALLVNDPGLNRQ